MLALVNVASVSVSVLVEASNPTEGAVSSSAIVRAVAPVTSPLCVALVTLAVLAAIDFLNKKS